MIQIQALRHLYPEQAGFYINRPNGHPKYTFLHFFNPMDILVGGKLVHTRPHACIIYRPNERQFFQAKENILHDWLHFDGVSEDFFSSLSLQTETLYYPQFPDFITRILREAENEFYQSSYRSEDLSEIKIRELFIKFARAVHGEIPQPVDKGTKETFRRLRTEMFLRLDEPWTVERMANFVGLSQSRFFYVYKTLFGATPTNDLIQAKINAAKNALLSGDISVSELSEKLGYQNLTHFLRQFKKETGFSPSEYRKNGF